MPDLPIPDFTLPDLALADGAWPLVVLGLRVAVAAGLYLFLVAAFRALRAELRAGASVPAESVPAAAPPVGTTGSEAPASNGRGEPAWLEILRCDGSAELTGRRYPLDEVTLVGRSVDNTVVLPDRRVSSRHARLETRNGDWWVEDLGSTNGTFVGPRRVDGARRVEPATELRFGPVVARVTHRAARR